jgi:hypothetical protein
MRPPHTALWDVKNELGMLETVRDTLEQDPQNPGRWLLTFESTPGSLIHSRLHVEVMEGDPHPFACVLERKNVGYSAMTRIMDKLMRRLDRPPRSSRALAQPPSGGSPPSSPVQDRHEPRADDT